MKSSLVLLVVALLFVFLLVACVPGPNMSKGSPAARHVVAGFWLGLWHGLIAPFVFVASLFKDDLAIYEVHNNGAWYNFGFLVGMAFFFGGGGCRAQRRK